MNAAPPLRRDVAHMDPWVADALLAACGALFHSSEGLAEASGRLNRGFDGQVGALGDPLVRFVRAISDPEYFNSSSSTFEAPLSERELAAAATAESRITADHVWGRLVAFANVEGIVALRRRFEEVDSVNPATGRPTGVLGLVQLQRLLETVILPATMAAKHNAESSSGGESQPALLPAPALPMRTLLQFISLAASRQPPPAEMYDDGAAAAALDGRGGDLGAPEGFSSAVALAAALEALSMEQHHCLQKSHSGGGGDDDDDDDSVAVDQRERLATSAAAVGAAADVRLCYAPLCAAVAGDLRRLRKLQSARILPAVRRIEPSGLPSDGLESVVPEPLLRCVEDFRMAARRDGRTFDRIVDVLRGANFDDFGGFCACTLCILTHFCGAGSSAQLFKAAKALAESGGAEASARHKDALARITALEDRVGSLRTELAEAQDTVHGAVSEIEVGFSFLHLGCRWLRPVGFHAIWLPGRTLSDRRAAPRSPSWRGAWSDSRRTPARPKRALSVCTTGSVDISSMVGRGQLSTCWLSEPPPCPLVPPLGHRRNG